MLQKSNRTSCFLVGEDVAIPESQVKRTSEELRVRRNTHAAAHAEWAREYLAASPWAGMVGAFEGAGYSATGLYRPMLDCLMFSRRVQPYCRVCERAVEAMILRYSE